MELISTHFIKSANVGYHGNLFGGTMLAWLDEAGQIIKIYGAVMTVGETSITIRLEARRHSVYNGSQRTVLTTDMTFVRIDGDGEAIPVGEKVKNKFKDTVKENGNR